MIIDRRGLLTAGAGVIAAPTLAQAATPAAAAMSRGWDGMDVPMKRQDGSPMVVRIVFPTAPKGPAPLIAFSHGALSNGGSYDAVIGPWAERGYVVAAPTHQDSETLPKSGLTPAQQNSARVWEIQSMLDSAGEIADLLKPRGVSLDPELRAVAGHSYGGMISAIFGGAVWTGADGALQAKPNRLKAIVALSPPGRMLPSIDGTQFKSLDGPILVTSGTKDIPLMPGAAWADHLIPYETSKAAPAYALVGEDVDHYLGGLICRFNLPGPPQWEGLADINTVSALFLDAMVRGDAGARAKLDAMVGSRKGLVRSELRHRA